MIYSVQCILLLLEVYKPGKISFKLAGGLLLSSVSLNSAFLTGATGFMTSFTGSLTLAVATLGAPASSNRTFLNSRYLQHTCTECIHMS